MRFFQRLAPGARTQHAVQPVLPPRFAGPGMDLQEVAAETSASPVRVAPLPAAVPETAQPAPSHARVDASKIQSIPHATPQPAPDTPPSAYAADAHAPSAGPALDAAPSPRAPALDAGTGARSYAPPVARAAHVHESSIGPALDIAPPARPRREAAPAPPAPQRPLSAHALAQRIQGPKSDTTIVHVTIDRIDVRAPAPAPAPPGQAKPRPTPATSLADYLRRGRP